MSNPLDTDAGSELFASYEGEFKVVQADLEQKLDQIPELSGEPRKAAISAAERALEEADELVRATPILPFAFLQELTRGSPPLSLAKCASRSRISLPPPAPR